MITTQDFFDLIEKSEIENNLKIQWLNIFNLKEKVYDNIFRYKVGDNTFLFIIEKQGKYEALLSFDEKSIGENIEIQKSIFSYHYNIEITNLTSVYIPESSYKGDVIDFILFSLNDERKIEKRQVIYNLIPFSSIDSIREISENETPSFHLVDINTQKNEQIDKIYDEKENLYNKIEMFSDRDLSLSFERKNDSLTLTLSLK